MTAVAMPVRQNTPAWLDARLEVIGSSDMPVLTGNSPYRSSPFDLWAVKTRLAEPAPVDERTQELFDLGHALEPVIADRYVVRTGRRVRRVNLMVRSRQVPWAAASLDRVSAVKGERRIVELKWVPYRSWTEGPEAVPAYVQDQVQWQLMVTGWPVADVAVLLGSHLEVHEVESDPAYQAHLLVIARWFRDLVERGERPPIDGSEATRKALLRLYPKDDGTYLEPTAELHALMAEWREARPAAKAATEREDRIKNTVRALLGEHAGSECDAWRVTHKLTKGRTVTNWEAVAKAYRSELGDLMAPEELDAIESLHRMTGDGTRMLTPRWKGEDEGQWT